MTPHHTESERQVLIALIELEEPITTPNNTHYTFFPKSLEDAALYFRGLREDWTHAYQTLADRGLILNELEPIHLSDRGKLAARQERIDHPPIWYWYREFFAMAARSQAYNRFCARLYGRNLCQAGFSDIPQFDFLVKISGLSPGDHALDLGCGNGGFAEYMVEKTGAHVSGIDYVPEAIEQANLRDGTIRGCLDFRLANLDHLDLPAGSFDAITSIDTLYMPNDLPATLLQMRDWLVPGGKMYIFYTEMLFDPNASREILSAEGSGLALALRKVGLKFKWWNFSEALCTMLRRKHQLAVEMQSDFESEGTQFIHNFLMMESDNGVEPYDPDKYFASRFLYQISTD